MNKATLLSPLLALAAFLVLSPCVLAAEPKVKLLDDFESGAINWTGDYRGSIVSEYATHGEKAFKVTFPKGVDYPTIVASKVDLDWSGYDTLKMDVYNPQGRPVGFVIRIDDDKSGPTYASRYNGEILLVNGQTHLEIPFDRIKASDRPIDVAKIKLFEIFMDRPAEDTVLYFDNIRVTAGRRGARQDEGRDFAMGDVTPEIKAARDKAEAARVRLQAIIDAATKRGFGTLEANIALVTAGLGLDVRPELPWYKGRQGELYEYVARSCDEASDGLTAVLDGKRSAPPVPPIYNTATLAFQRARPRGEGRALRGRPPDADAYLLDALSARGAALRVLHAGRLRFPLQRLRRREPIRRGGHAALRRVPPVPRHPPRLERRRRLVRPHRARLLFDGRRQRTRRRLPREPAHKGRHRGVPQGQRRASGRITLDSSSTSWAASSPTSATATTRSRLFREYLAGQHKTIDTLNAVWGTDYKSFDDVTVMPNAKQAAENRARWYDWQAFNCKRFVDHAAWSKSVLRSISPEVNVAVGAVSYSLRPDFGRSGVDEENIIRRVDDVVLNECGPSTMTTDLLWSLSEGAKPMFDFEYHGDVASLLPNFLHGNTALAMWWWPDEPDTEFPQFNESALPYSWNIPLADVAEALKIALDVRRLSPEIAAFPKAPAEMAILYSRASMLQVPPEFATGTETPLHDGAQKRLLRHARPRRAGAVRLVAPGRGRQARRLTSSSSSPARPTRSTARSRRSSISRPPAARSS